MPSPTLAFSADPGIIAGGGLILGAIYMLYMVGRLLFGAERIPEHHGNGHDKHVLPMEKVTDYRTEVSGIRPRDIRKGGGALPFAQVQREVANLLQGRLLIGHAVHHDLKSMMLQHPRAQLRDTSLYPPLRSKDGRPRSLKHLAADVGLAIQSGESASQPTV